jgi:hypothetical protein
MHPMIRENGFTSRATRKTTAQGHAAEGLTHHFTLATNVVPRARTTVLQHCQREQHHTPHESRTLSMHTRRSAARVRGKKRVRA